MESSCSPVVVARVVFLMMGFIMIVTLAYTIYIDGSPFRADLLTPWMDATLIDLYLNVAPIATWVCYKESFWDWRICLNSLVDLFWQHHDFLVYCYSAIQNLKLHLILLISRHTSYTFYHGKTPDYVLGLFVMIAAIFMHDDLSFRVVLTTKSL